MPFRNKKQIIGKKFDSGRNTAAAVRGQTKKFIFYKSRNAMNKFHNKKIEIDNIKFHSAGEANHYVYLKMLQQSKKISALQLQVPFKLIVNNIKICTFVVDFFYFDNDLKKQIADDFKGFITPDSKLKLKLFLALYPQVVLRITKKEGVFDITTIDKLKNIY